MEAETKTLRYRKACGCKGATASGPRVVHASLDMVFDQMQLTAQMAGLACDECDTPWKIEDPEETIDGD